MSQETTAEIYWNNKLTTFFDTNKTEQELMEYKFELVQNITHLIKESQTIPYSSIHATASEYTKERSMGNRQQDRDTYFDFVSGFEKALELLKNKK